MGQKINFIITPEIASGANGGIVVGEFNNWNETEALPLKVQKDGSLKATAVLDEGKSYQYRYLLNDGRWVNDANANSYYYDPVFNVENCVVTVEAKKTRSPKAETTVEIKSKKAEALVETKSKKAEASVKTKSPKAETTVSTKSKKDSKEAVKDSVTKTTKAGSKKGKA